MSVVKSIRLPVSANLKIMLVLMAALIVGGTLWYTQQLVRDMRRSERRTIRFYASMMQRSFSSWSSAMDPSTSLELSAQMLDLFQTIDFPVVVTDTHHIPLSGINQITKKRSFDDWIKNVDVDTSLSSDEQLVFLRDRVQDMGERYTPLKIYNVSGQDSILQNYMYYDDSSVVKQLAWLPYIQIIIGTMFILVAYLSFSHIKRNEQSNIWVGMARETAHQLGTPISSLMGWVELLRYTPDNPEQVLEATDEMQRDIDRLNKVSQRFSKIGSTPQLAIQDLNAVIRGVVAYFERRLPHLGKRVVLDMDAEGPAYAAINTGLMEWVFENLVRNAADAIDAQEGRILIRVQPAVNEVIVDISDNGRGVDPKIRNEIFRPGFSTKQRGWGLGLSLAKRIVEEYHGGKITLHESSPNGTTFRIRLKAALM